MRHPDLIPIPNRSALPARSSLCLDGFERVDLIAELNQRYSVSGSNTWAARYRFSTKRWLWLGTVEGAKAIKRLSDIALSALALICLSPLMALVALTIWLTDRHAVFFWQVRVGQWGSEFLFPKFRSMRIDAEVLKSRMKGQNHHKSGVTFKMRNDPRMTRVGRIIRRLSIDELPQFYCVLKGDMSLVGPRPALPLEVARYTLADRRRLDVKPGLTCFWQVNGRADVPFDQQVLLDKQYIESQSLWTDVKILLKTIPAVLTGKGAY